MAALLCKQPQIYHGYNIGGLFTSKPAFGHDSRVWFANIGMSMTRLQTFSWHLQIGFPKSFCNFYSIKDKQYPVKESCFRTRRRLNNVGGGVFHLGPVFAKRNAGIDCPVPYEQQPINEYQNLVGSALFSWAVEDVRRYGMGLTAIGVSASILLGWPIVALSVSPQEELLKCSVGAVCCGLFAVTLAALRIYLGWAYVGNRLFSATVEYEETGWYDGEVWVKPPEVLARDRLLGSYEVKPALNRVKLTLLMLAMLLTSTLLFFTTLKTQNSNPPIIETNGDDTVTFYGSAYSDDSAQRFEPDAFLDDADDEKGGLADYCY